MLLSCFTGLTPQRSSISLGEHGLKVYFNVFEVLHGVVSQKNHFGNVKDVLILLAVVHFKVFFKNIKEK